jgi:hypothetical protein
MLNLAIQLLWFLIGVLFLCGVVALVIYGIETFIQPLPGRLKQGIWFIVLILVLIAILTMVAGGGIHSLSFR